ncbi:MAG: cell division protein FtsL [Spirochaetales bacterium]|nr:cell division protein FtsL [Spirochaetales bacterium]
MKHLKKWILLSCVALLPVLFFLNAWQSFRYSSLKREIRRLEAHQIEKIEENKRSIIAMAILDFPERIISLAESALGLKKPPIERYIEIRPSTKERSSDG